ncbi:hypothetical protein LTR15_007195 [Elasticomyces elasticus]|nr:hypothetical protein LTR15_007195 [Elasticomyces elasticus]
MSARANTLLHPPESPRSAALRKAQASPKAAHKTRGANSHMNKSPDQGPGRGGSRDRHLRSTHAARSREENVETDESNNSGVKIEAEDDEDDTYGYSLAPTSSNERGIDHGASGQTDEESSRTRDQLREDNARLLDELKQLQETVRSREFRITDLEEDLTGSRMRITTLDQELHRAKRTNTKLMTSKKLQDQENRNDLDTLEWQDSEIRTLRCQVRTLQEGAMRFVEAPHWVPESIAEIERKFKVSMNEIARWSKSHTGRDWDLELDLARKHVELLPSSSHVDMSIMLKTVASHQGRPGRDRQPWLLRSTMVGTIAIDHIVKDPLFAFSGTDDDEECGPFRKSNALCIKEIMKAIEPGDPGGADAWRCSMMRLLDPVATKNTIGGDSVKAIASRARGAAATLVAASYAKAMAATPLDQVAQNDLNVALRKLADTAWTLWSRKMRVEVIGLTKLKAELRVESLQYKAGSDLLEAHSLNVRDLDRNPAALDGMDVLLVVSPAVVAVDMAAATDSRERLVLKKAVVWMG